MLDDGTVLGEGPSLDEGTVLDEATVLDEPTVLDDRTALGEGNAVGALVWKVLGTGSAIIAGLAARKVITAAWRTGTGSPPPTNPESPDTSWKEAVGWAVVSGALVGVARLMATRKAAEYYRKSAGHLPKALEEVS